MEIQFVSAAPWLPGSSLAHKLVDLFTRSAAMGLLSGPAHTRLDGAAVNRLVEDLQRQGIASTTGAGLATLVHEAESGADPAAAAALEARIDRVAEALESSAAPRAEWPAMREVLGDEALADLVEVSLSSLRRYAAGERDTPPAIVDRLHWLAMVVADLNGAYNDHGIRRWFQRPRAQLGGLSPRACLGRGWQVDDDSARRVRDLARRLSGAQALAV